MAVFVGLRAAQPWLPLRAYLRRAADALDASKLDTSFTRAEEEQQVCQSGDAKRGAGQDETGDGERGGDKGKGVGECEGGGECEGLLFVASDNSTLLGELHWAMGGSEGGSERERALRRRLLPPRLRSFRLVAWPTRVEGSTLPRLTPELRAHRSAPSVIHFSGTPDLAATLRMAALEDLLVRWRRMPTRHLT